MTCETASCSVRCIFCLFHWNEQLVIDCHWSNTFEQYYIQIWFIFKSYKFLFWLTVCLTAKRMLISWNHKFLWWHLPSCTMTLKVYVAVLPDGSLKIYVTGVTPVSKYCPGVWLALSKVTLPELSVAVGTGNCTVVPPSNKGIVTTLSSGPETTGGRVSTETLNVINIMRTCTLIMCCNQAEWVGSSDLLLVSDYFYTSNLCQ